jgi:hypothetical protein
MIMMMRVMMMMMNRKKITALVVKIVNEYKYTVEKCGVS